MPLFQPRVPSRPLRLVLAALAVLLPALVGWGITLSTTYLGLRDEAEHALTDGGREMHAIFERSQHAARQVLPLAGQPCTDEAVYQLLHQVTTVLYVRTVNLARGDHLYCSSLFGRQVSDARLEGYAHGRALLMPGNNLTPDEPVLVWREPAAGDAAVLVGVSGGHLRSALRHGLLGQGVMLQVGPNWMDGKGRVHTGSIPHNLLFDMRQNDPLYPFSLVVSYDVDELLSAAWRAYEPMLVLLVLVGLFGAWGAYHWMSQPRAAGAVIERARARGEFVPYLQPLVSPVSGRWLGAEVLLRWRDGDQVLAPGAFIGAVEQSGSLDVITGDLMAATTAGLAGARLPAGFHLAFNVTATQLANPALVPLCRGLRARLGETVVPVLELTERETFDLAGHGGQLAELFALGVELALDDFGTGQSSLAYLSELHVHTLKIDRAFVDAIERDSLGKVVLDAVIALGQSLGLKLVAEGVETAAQRDYLAAAGVDVLQGYYFARPMPLADFVRQLPDHA